MKTNNPLRESMVQVKEIARTIYSTSEKGSHHEDLAEKIVELAHAALSEPVKNFEVGTAEEQYRRHDKFCDATRNGMSGYRCEDAPQCVLCFAKWAQMPYAEQEGGAK